MNPLHYGRVAAAGWIFLVTVLASIWIEGGGRWKALQDFLETNNTSTTIAVLGALAALGAPPALGLLLERVAGLLLLLTGHSLWKYSFSKELIPVLCGKEGSHATLPAAGTFHALFYTYADTRLLEWMRRRITQIYSSITSALAIILGLVITLALDTLSPLVLAISIVTILDLVWHARIVDSAVEETGRAWVRTLGRKAAKELTPILRDLTIEEPDHN